MRQHDKMAVMFKENLEAEPNVPPPPGRGCGFIFMAIMLLMAAAGGSALGVFVWILDDAEATIQILEDFRPRIGSKVLSSDDEVLGEFTNETNAVLTDVVITFFLYDNKDNILGYAKAEWGLPLEIFPGELIPFRATSSVAFDRVSSWKAIWDYTADRIPHDFATGVEQVSWGQVKTSLPFR